MKLGKLFNLQHGNDFALNALKPDENGINFVSRTGKNNGVSGVVANIETIEPFKEGLITVALSGSVLESFVQLKPFYTGFHIMVLEPKTPMTLSEKLFYCECIRKNRYRYSYGRQANKTLEELGLPDQIPDWAKIKHSTIDIDRSPIVKIKLSLKDRPWKVFRYDEIFEIKKGYYNNKPPESQNGKIPFIGATALNNGVTSYHDIGDIKRYNKIGKVKEDDGKRIFEKNCITVSNNGSVGYAFYQSIPFTCSHDVNPVYLLEHQLNVFIAIFLSTIIGLERYRWNYGRKWRPKRMSTSLIKLPVDGKGKPDWNFMENYIKSLSYSKALSIT